MRYRDIFRYAYLYFCREAISDRGGNNERQRDVLPVLERKTAEM